MLALYHFFSYTMNGQSPLFHQSLIVAITSIWYFMTMQWTSLFGEAEAVGFCSGRSDTEVRIPELGPKSTAYSITLGKLLNLTILCFSHI